MRHDWLTSTLSALLVFLTAMHALVVCRWTRVYRGLRRGRMRFAGNAPSTYQTREHVLGIRTREPRAPRPGAAAVLGERPDWQRSDAQVRGAHGHHCA